MRKKWISFVAAIVVIILLLPACGHARMKKLIRLPKAFQVLDSEPVKLAVRLKRGMNPATFRAWLNKQEITDRFNPRGRYMIADVDRSDHLRVDTDPQSDLHSFDGLNFLKVRVEGRRKWHATSDFRVFFVRFEAPPGDTTYSGTYCITDFEIRMTIDRLDDQVAFTLMVEPDQVLEGTGSVSGTEMTLQAEDPEMGDISLQLSFAPDGESFTGTYIVESNGEIETGPFNGTLGECEFYGPPGDIEMLTPYRLDQDVAAVTGGYSTTDQCPWGRIHNGIDISPRADLMEFQAVAAGKVTRISKFLNDINGFYQVNVSIKYNSNFEVEYAFEPMSPEEAHGDEQMALIQAQIAVGEEVVQGQVIGRLLSRHSADAHVHFGMYQNRESACPELYFTPAARLSIIELLQIWWPTADRICYE